MSRVIWKYPLSLRERQLIVAPGGAEARGVQVQRGQICVWLEHDPLGPESAYDVVIVGTGHPVPLIDGHFPLYVGTVQVEEFVWHVYVKEVEQ